MDFFGLTESFIRTKRKREELMIARIHAERGRLNDSVLTIGGSKSESNRLLILKALFENITLNNISNSDDSRVMTDALRRQHGEIDIHHAGTAMRFLTAFYAALDGSEVVLTGSSRMKERPISILVDAMRKLGGSVEYLGKEGYPPLAINGKKLRGGKISIKAGTSSQYITALMLIGATLENGLVIELEGAVTSRPYIDMTIGLMRQIGIEVIESDRSITVQPVNTISDTEITVESDWSSASYFFSIVALSEGLTVTLKYYNKNSLQGDSDLVRIYSMLGVETVFNDDQSITITKSHSTLPEQLELDLNATPDIAQTLAVTCLALKIPCAFSGLHTLRIKETDRLQAIQNEFLKLGTDVTITEESLEMKAAHSIKTDVKIDTYNDHRMAMAFAPLGLFVPVRIDDPEVVSKSFPDYWDKLEELGFSIDFQI